MRAATLDLFARRALRLTATIEPTSPYNTRMILGSEMTDANNPTGVLRAASSSRRSVRLWAEWS